MNQPPDKRYASAPGPVNRRTVRRETLAAPELPPVVQQRLLQAQARQRLGRPLYEQLAPHGSGNGMVYALAGVASVLAAAGLWLLWPSTGLAMEVGGGLLLLTGAGTGFWAWRIRQQSPPPAMESFHLPMLNADDLHGLDKTLEQLAPQLPEASLSRLLELKAGVLRLLPLMERSGVGEAFTLDDRLYVIECLRRYLPDTLLAYLDVPEQLRTVAGANDSARTLLNRQLDLLIVELRQREEGLVKEAAQGLLRQQRFLESKRGE